MSVYNKAIHPDCRGCIHNKDSMCILLNVLYASYERCKFRKTYDEEKSDLIKCADYQRMTLNEYCDMLNRCINTTFFNKFKDKEE